MTQEHRRLYKTKAWRLTRVTVITEAGFRCEECKRPIVLHKREATKCIPVAHVDHIKTVKEAPELQLERSNLRCLCEPCHNRRTIYDQGVHKNSKRKLSSACDVNGWPTDKEHSWND